MRQFLKQTGASCLGTLLGLLVFAGLGLGALALLLAVLLGSSERSPLEDKSILLFNLSTTIQDTPSSPKVTDVLSPSRAGTMTLRQTIEAIEKAAEDPKIVGLFLYGRSTVGGYGYATLTEVRQALEKFRATGKKILAYDMDWTEKEYYLGSIASKVTMNPVGSMEMNGLVSQGTFLTGALDKYGIGVQVVKVGTFKGAVEPYTRQDFSPQNREQIGQVLNTIWSNYKTAIATSRKTSPASIQAIADSKGILKAQAAKNSGLVDEVAYFDQVSAELRELTGQKEPEKDAQGNFSSFRQITLENYAAEVTGTEGNSSQKVAVLYAEGTIVDGAGDAGEIGGDRFARELRKLQRDEDIKAVVLRINSPGGSATAADVILREVTRLGEEKPVIISMGDYAASGGYWIATGGQRIFADRDTLTGSIGVFGILLNFQKIANNNGVRWDAIETGKFAAIGTNTRPKTPAELKLYQESVNQFYDLFIEKVAKARKLSPDKVRSIAQGRVWTGEKALSIGLVDEIGGLEMAVQYAAKVAKLGEDWSIEEFPETMTWEEEFISRLFQSYLPPLAKTDDPIDRQWRNLQKELALLQTFNDPQNVYARLWFPFEVR